MIESCIINDAITHACTRHDERPQNATIEKHLWVDRYRPKRYLDLLGDDRVHRETMSWLKEWDYCVFGRKNVRRRNILLLSGPPGLGKTTLAHVLASSAGYAVHEINASDERAARIVDERIRPTLEAGSGVGSKKPVCLIIDEIDGVGGAGGESNAFIGSLIQLTLDKPRKKVPGRRGNQKDVRPLLRPIICICNDLYAPSLRSLRQYARLVRLRAPTPLTLTNRLRDVCELEGLKADNRALSALVGVTKGDIRSCLNTLQFIRSRTIEVTESIVRSATIGMKDSELSTQQVWNDIFLPLSKKRARQLGLADGEESRYVTRLNFEVEATDEVERVMQGRCFARLRDSPWATFEKAHEWLDSFDMFTGTFKGGDDPIWALREYRSYFVVAFSPIFSNPGNPKAEFPQADYEAYLTAKANEEIYSSFAKQLSAEVKKSFPQELFPTELLPLLNRIISPSLKTVNNQVVKAEERAVLDKLVQLMADMNMRFVQEKTEEGQLVYRLDPPIDVFITYDGKRSADVGTSRFGLRQVISREVDIELERRSAEVVERGKTTRTATFFGKNTDGPIQGVDVMPARHAKGSVAADPSEKVCTQLVGSISTPPLDFFGRPLVPSTKIKAAASKLPVSIQKFRVAYKFHEGNSAAVRRPIKISSLL
ncbi:P-loop containing nucleoside triphosphate hydrolase protein [Calocera cornea HHB12733]|uniref:p-loop containing nucleoside triphosphate hydrolase protein n=1 Tax=Calocera cornea HHB12733 TaxID=1353952 RepID=A0A165ELG8_9BASI|nr:P-loop containing nucleoside triphosphate hydrolase protein [Calocera cornea HHB12733]